MLAGCEIIGCASCRYSDKFCKVLEFFSSTGLGTEEPLSSSSGELVTDAATCFCFYKPYTQKLAVVKKNNAAIMVMAEIILTTMDSFRNMWMKK